MFILGCWLSSGASSCSGSDSGSNMYGSTATCCLAAISPTNSTAVMVTWCRTHVFHEAGRGGRHKYRLWAAYAVAHWHLKGKGTQTGHLEQGCELVFQEPCRAQSFCFLWLKLVTKITFRHQGTMSRSSNEHDMGPLTTPKKHLGTEDINCWSVVSEILTHSCWNVQLQLLNILGSPLSYFALHNAPLIFSGRQVWTAGRPV